MAKRLKKALEGLRVRTSVSVATCEVYSTHWMTCPICQKRVKGRHRCGITTAPEKK